MKNSKNGWSYRNIEYTEEDGLGGSDLSFEIFLRSCEFENYDMCLKFFRAIKDFRIFIFLRTLRFLWCLKSWMKRQELGKQTKYLVNFVWYMYSKSMDALDDG